MLIPGARPDLCLAFADTRYWRGSAEQTETLKNLGDLLGWLAAEAAAAEEAREVEAWARDYPANAGRLFADAIALRETVYRVFSAVAEGEPAADSDLAALNRALAEAPARRRLAPLSGGYGWNLERAGRSAPVLLAPVLWSAADLLTGPARGRVRRCANEKCLWLFLDESRGGARRWCSMAACGNRAKASRHYHKHKQG